MSELDHDDEPECCCICGATNVPGIAFDDPDFPAICLWCAFADPHPIPKRTPLDDIADDFDKAVDEAARGQGP